MRTPENRRLHPLGATYGSLTVIGFEGRARRVRCSCGTEKIIRTDHLTRVKSCGCRGSLSLSKLRASVGDEMKCQECGITVQRGSYGRAYWSSRKFCSNECHFASDRKGREAKFWLKVRKAKSPNGCWLWAGKRDQDGYGRVRYHGVETPAHRKAYELKCGEIPAGMVVRHSCDNPPCVNPAHLSVGTVADNSADMMSRGRSAVRIGQKNTAAKLTELQVRSIFSDQRHYREIADAHSISSWTVFDIKAGRSWGHLRLKEASL
ncbi:HNH endonuclease signature motif containing protein [Bosea eneae]